MLRLQLLPIHDRKRIKMKKKKKKKRYDPRERLGTRSL